VSEDTFFSSRWVERPEGLVAFVDGGEGAELRVRSDQFDLDAAKLSAEQDATLVRTEVGLKVRLSAGAIGPVIVTIPN
jgi:hypothetical protein